MARKIQTLVLDDLDPTGQTDADETIKFALDGQEYEIDLSKQNAENLRAALAPYVEHARRGVNGKRRGRKPGLAPQFAGPGDANPPLAMSTEARQAIRDWWNATHPETPVGKKGRIAANVIAEYNARN